MSKRSDLMSKVADFVSGHGLCRVYSDYGLSKDKKYRYVLFNTPRTLDGEVRIYGPKFFIIKFQTAYRALPRNGHTKFDNLEDTLKFLKVAFVDLDMDEALEMY